MADRRSILLKLAGAADLSDEPLPGLPILELAGDRRVLIEGHCGVMAYTSCCICVKVRFGQIVVEGCGMQLSHMSKEQLVITGAIHAVKLVKGDRK